jgi:hypothetical protein
MNDQEISIPAEFFKDYTTDQFIKFVLDDNGVLGEAECARLSKMIGKPVSAPMQVMCDRADVEKLIQGIKDGG